MKEHESRIAVRLPTYQKERVKQIIISGKFKNMSQVIRQALSEFLQDGGDQDASK